jgi:C1A family cysteine protease
MSDVLVYRGIHLSLAQPKLKFMPFDYRTIKLGWTRDIPDTRDVSFETTRDIRIAPLPAKVDLRKMMPAIYFQGTLGSCTAHAIGAGFEYCKKKQKRISFMPSRLFIYYNEREIENTINKDNGAQIRSGMKVSKKFGFCKETNWPYDGEGNLFKNKPSDVCYNEALNHQLLSYEKVRQNVNAMKTCLADGLPFVFGIEIFSSIYDVGKDGMIPMPKAKEKHVGGHAILCVGYDEKNKVFIIRNSWDTEWGDKGYGYMPYDYLTSTELSDSFWTMKLVE